MKKITRTAAAAFVSFGLVGTFALPAYATSTSGEEQFESKTTQTMTAAVSTANYKLDSPSVALDPDVVAREQREEDQAREDAAAEVERNSRLAQQEAEATEADTAQTVAQPAGPSASDVASGASAGGISGAALAQIGVSQDCTDLVQNSLAAMGVDTRRDAGGYDRGTGVGDWAGFGATMGGGGSYSVGDILIWPGQHVAIYIGDGKAVHGGWNGSQTVVHDALLYGAHPSSVVRPG